MIEQMDADSVPKSDYLAILRMLVRRATWLDKWRAKRRPGHWLNRAKRELLIEHGTLVQERLSRILAERRNKQHGQE